jgi:hypothetical protein
VAQKNSPATRVRPRAAGCTLITVQVNEHDLDTVSCRLERDPQAGPHVQEQLPAMDGTLRLTHESLNVTAAPLKMCAPLCVLAAALCGGAQHLFLPWSADSHLSASPACSKSIQFELMSNLEVQSAAELHVYERNLYSMPQRTPLEHGVLDPRLVRGVPGAPQEWS